MAAYYHSGSPSKFRTFLLNKLRMAAYYHSGRPHQFSPFFRFILGKVKILDRQLSQTAHCKTRRALVFVLLYWKSTSKASKLSTDKWVPRFLLGCFTRGCMQIQSRFLRFRHLCTVFFFLSLCHVLASVAPTQLLSCEYLSFRFGNLACGNWAYV